MQAPGDTISRETLEAWETRYIRYLAQQYRSTDAAHDIGHFRRVWQHALKINAGEGNTANNLVLLTAAYFHDFINLPKSHPDRSKASLICAERVQQILEEDFPDFPAALIPGVYHAVLTHSFSAGIPPETQEACILQDADRMEALGAIGLSRVFYTAGQMNSALFDPEDPLALNRMPDDKRFALDHFQVKLLQLPALMRTPTGKAIATTEAAYLQTFLDKINKEISGS
jgi:uncharacterized protein